MSWATFTAGTVTQFAFTVYRLNHQTQMYERSVRDREAAYERQLADRLAMEHQRHERRLKERALEKMYDERREMMELYAKYRDGEAAVLDNRVNVWTNSG